MPTYEDLTGSDLFDCIQALERNEVGMTKVLATPHGINIYPQYAFHIYNGRRQVNICKMMSADDNGTSIANILFDDDLVSYAYVNHHGVADYDRMLVTYQSDRLIDLPGIIFRENQHIVHLVLREALCAKLAFCNRNLKMSQEEPDQSQKIIAATSYDAQAGTLRHP